MRVHERAMYAKYSAANKKESRPFSRGRKILFPHLRIPVRSKFFGKFSGKKIAKFQNISRKLIRGDSSNYDYSDAKQNYKSHRKPMLIVKCKSNAGKVISVVFVS